MKSSKTIVLGGAKKLIESTNHGLPQLPGFPCAVRGMSALQEGIDLLTHPGELGLSSSVFGPRSGGFWEEALPIEKPPEDI